MKKLFIVFVLILIGLQYRLWSSNGGVSEWLRLQNELALAQAKIKILEDKNQALKNIVIDLQSHTDSIETHAREVLHFLAPGETFYRIIHVPKEAPPPYLPDLPRTQLSAPEVTENPLDAAAEAPP
jgi:cell division protein FtsB